MRDGRQKVTLKDIAQATGYSINTVSRALRGKDDIAPETREKIEQTQKEMGYIINNLASSLRRGYSNTIAVILGDISNPHFSIIMSDIELRARSYGYGAILMTTNEDEELEMNAIQSALNKNVDGIILCPCQKSDANIRYLQSVGVPFVLIGRRFDSLDTDYVICDDEMGGYLATKELIRNGHKRILMLQGAPYISSARERLAGYIKAHEEAGLPTDMALVCEGSVMGEKSNAYYEQIMSRNMGFTAVFAFSDLSAWDFWRFLHLKGYNVPEDFSLVGFDHIQSRLYIPYELSSVCSHKKLMSVETVDVLVRKMRGETGEEHEHRVIETAIVRGETIRNVTENGYAYRHNI